jgi:hypothetical protein
VGPASSLKANEDTELAKSGVHLRLTSGGTGPQPSADGLSHLTLITCAGTFRNGTHDHRLVVYATRIA